MSDVVSVEFGPALGVSETVNCALPPARVRSPTRSRLAVGLVLVGLSATVVWSTFLAWAVFRLSLGAT